jgi:CheY-like chemotaxis protein
MKLLVVGSNPLVRRMVLNVVADLASDIRECASAAEAIAAYAGDSPDFVLADANRPGSAGVEQTVEQNRANHAQQGQRPTAAALTY